MPKFEYTDFHKFLVSVGALLAAAGFAVPIFLLQEKTVAGAPAKKISELTPIGREIYSSQQEQVRWLVQWWPAISSPLLAVGVAFIIWGGVNWKKRQNHLEKREEAELKKLHVENEKLQEEVVQLVRGNLESPQEAAEATERKAEESAEEFQDEESRETREDGSISGARREDAETKYEHVDPAYGRASERSQRSSLISLYVKAEDQTALALRQVLADKGQVFSNVRIGKNFRADMVVLGSKLNLGVDVKVLSLRNWKTNISKRINDAISFSLRLESGSEAEIGRRLRPLLVYVLGDLENMFDADNATLEKVAERVIDELQDPARRFHERPLVLITTFGGLNVLSRGPKGIQNSVRDWLSEHNSFVLRASSDSIAEYPMVEE